MCLTWFIISKKKALFFNCSTTYALKRQVWSDYRGFEDAIIWMRTAPEQNKIQSVGKFKAIFITGKFIPSNFITLGEGCDLLSFAYLLKGEIEELNQHVRDDYCIYLFGYDKNRGMEGYHVCYSELYEPLKMKIPMIQIISATSEPKKILEDFIGNRDQLTEENMCILQKRMLRGANKLFDLISRKYPCYMEPLKISSLDRNGFRYIQK
jgi:hypothetical protein